MKPETWNIENNIKRTIQHLNIYDSNANKTTILWNGDYLNTTSMHTCKFNRFMKCFNMILRKKYVAKRNVLFFITREEFVLFMNTVKPNDPHINRYLELISLMKDRKTLCSKTDLEIGVKAFCYMNDFINVQDYSIPNEDFYDENGNFIIKKGNFTNFKPYKIKLFMQHVDNWINKTKDDKSWRSRKNNKINHQQNVEQQQQHDSLIDQPHHQDQSLKEHYILNKEKQNIKDNDNTMKNDNPFKATIEKLEFYSRNNYDFDDIHEKTKIHIESSLDVYKNFKNVFYTTYVPTIKEETYKFFFETIPNSNIYRKIYQHRHLFETYKTKQYFHRFFLNFKNKETHYQNLRDSDVYKSQIPRNMKTINEIKSEHDWFDNLRHTIDFLNEHDYRKTKAHFTHVTKTPDKQNIENPELISDCIHILTEVTNTTTRFTWEDPSNRHSHYYEHMKLECNQTKHIHYYIKKWNEHKKKFKLVVDDTSHSNENNPSMKIDSHRWVGLHGGTKKYILSNPLSFVNLTLYVYSWLFRLDNVFNTSGCNPGFPYLPNPDNCDYPQFEIVNFQLYPIGFDPQNPQCENYASLKNYLVGIFYTVSTPIVGYFIQGKPGRTMLLSWAVLNTTGQPGIAALPPNLIICLGLNLFNFFVISGISLCGCFGFSFFLGFYGALERKLFQTPKNKKIETIIGNVTRSVTTAASSANSKVKMFANNTVLKLKTAATKTKGILSSSKRSGIKLKK